MHNPDFKILELAKILKAQKKVLNKDFYDSIGFVKENVHRIRKGQAHFTAEHISKIGKIYNVNTNWIFDLESNVYRK